VLYRPDWHEPLTERAWNEAWVRDRIDRVVRDAVQRYDPDELWPSQEWDAWETPRPVVEIFCGAAGVVWGLARLDADFDAAAAAARVHERSVLDSPSLFVGATGVALVRHLLAPSDAVRDELRGLIRANLASDANELMLGVPGTLVAARVIGDDELVLASAEAVRAARDEDGWWTQHIWNQTFRSLGPIHGLLGNLHVLGELESAREILREQALREDGHVNWQPGPDDTKVRLQWCHGAPGVIITASGVLDEDLLLGGAQLTWEAGPLDRVEKNAGLCHGTAGNGYTFLKTFEQTGDELWLERARAFAVHALEQVDALPPRYSLFTGGIGAALFASDCLDACARFPILDEWGTSASPLV
jgi:hypothetical protein